MTPLYRHDRTQRQDMVDAGMAWALTQVFGAGLAVPGEGTLARVELFLGRLRDAHEWLACGCRSDGGEPLLSIRRLGNGRHCLVRHGQVTHADGCPLHQLREPPPLSHVGGRERHDWRSRLRRVARAGTSEDAQADVDALLVQYLVNRGLTRVRSRHLAGGEHAKRPYRVSSWREAYRGLKGILSSQVDGVPLESLLSINGERLASDLLSMRSGELPTMPGRHASVAHVAIAEPRAEDDQELTLANVTAARAGLGVDSRHPCWVLAVYRPEFQRAWCVATQQVYSRALPLPVPKGWSIDQMHWLLTQLRYWHDHGLETSLHVDLTDHVLLLRGVGWRHRIVSAGWGSESQVGDTETVLSGDPGSEGLELRRQLSSRRFRAARA